MVNLIAVLGLFALVGCVFIWLGLRGKRLGVEPRCRGCGYELTGASSQVCSECGAPIDGRGTVFGKRRRRPLLLIVGVLAVLPFAGSLSTCGYNYVQTVNAYRFYPFDWVLSGATGGTVDALEELDRRLRSDGINDAQRQSIVAAALKEQSASSTSRATQIWVNMLEFLYQSGKLSQADTTRYFNQICTYTFTVRRRVCEFDAVPTMLETEWRSPQAVMPSGGLGRFVGLRCDQSRIRITKKDTGEEVALANRPGGVTSGAGRGHAFAAKETATHLVRATDLPPGEYEITVIFEEQHYADDVADPNEDSPKVHTRELRMTGDFELVDQDACNTVQLVNDASLEQAVRNVLTVGQVDVMPSTLGEDESLVGLMLHSGPLAAASGFLPIDIAFEITLRSGDDVWNFGNVVVHAGAMAANNKTAILRDFDADAVDVILRSSADAARETTDVTRIWDGEIVVKDVPVVRPGN
ncbi:MAG: hypothetical protein H6817_09250 [Phycisphaerales bacterium]|nr:hypothetical protein [Phycisphaerales bacterium]